MNELNKQLFRVAIFPQFFSQLNNLFSRVLESEEGIKLHILLASDAQRLYTLPGLHKRKGKGSTGKEFKVSFLNISQQKDAQKKYLKQIG